MSLTEVVYSTGQLAIERKFKYNFIKQVLMFQRRVLWRLM